MQVNSQRASRVMKSLVLVRNEVDREMKICVNDGEISFTCSESLASGHIFFYPTEQGLKRFWHTMHSAVMQNSLSLIQKISTFSKYSIPACWLTVCDACMKDSNSLMHTIMTMRDRLGMTLSLIHI